MEMQLPCSISDEGKVLEVKYKLGEYELGRLSTSECRKAIEIGPSAHEI